MSQTRKAALDTNVGQRALIEHRCTSSAQNRAVWNGSGWQCQCGDVVFEPTITALAAPEHVPTAGRVTNDEWIGRTYR